MKAELESQSPMTEADLKRVTESFPGRFSICELWGDFKQNSFYDTDGVELGAEMRLHKFALMLFTACCHFFRS